MKPTVGRIVHYHSYGTPGGEFKPEPRAAVVSEVNPDDPTLIGVVVLNPTGLFFNRNVKQAPDDAPVPGCWTWPPRV